MKPITLYKGNASYLCDTEARLAKFKAAGWSEDKPGAKKPEKGKKGKNAEKDDPGETPENET